MTDIEIIERILAGQKELYGELVTKYEILVLTAIRRSLPDSPEEIEDLAQEVFIKAYRSLDKYRGQAAFSTWLYRIAINCVIDYKRQTGTHPETETLYDNIAVPDTHLPVNRAPDPTPGSREIQLTIRQAFAGLPESYRRILFLHHYQGYSYAEISAKLGLPIKTVETRIYRAKKALRRILTMEEGGWRE
ncbi:MAG TPA: sigma-70 family RNA polymerase sigma factor [Bacillota bacterium]|nr:sigma-70 family RNA polymerase sigma factor [Bacillota bacterium]